MIGGMIGTLLDFTAGLVAIGAGVYLLSHGTGTISIGGEEGQSWFEIIAHGMGAYFVAKGIFMIRSGYHASIQSDYLKLLADRDND